MWSAWISRAALIRSLGLLGDDRTVESLAYILESGGPATGQIIRLVDEVDDLTMIFWALAQVPYERAAHVYRALLDVPQPHLRLSVVRALGARSHPAAREMLSAALDDPAAVVRETARSVLARSPGGTVNAGIVGVTQR